MTQDNRQPPKTHKDTNAPLDLKGKGKCMKEEEPISIADRFQASGRLFLNALGNGSDLSSQQQHGRKAGPNGSNTSGISRISTSTGEASSRRLRSSIQAAETLRLKTNLESGPPVQAYDDFLSADTTLNIDNDNIDPNKKEREKKCHSESPSVSQDISEQEKLDGSAVISLLDDHPDELDAVLLGAHDPVAEDEGGVLTPDAATKLGKSLFSTSSAFSGLSLDNLLNFNPEFLNRSGFEAERERQLYLGTRDTKQARSNWLQQWGLVLAGYTDHVWGDLEPLVVAARKEVKESEVRGSQAVSETKALDRLRQVLAHVRRF
ncbi:hypothetical protein FLONG3_9790 [Fusarium longipes]|uniref:Uncharacterized protein n=1 Tax=Fusarium longipes TaxID=694270 RepID=A0A395RVG0_9HYPO|nr:hypothetical protein FLONG3_9790 [Fusarium longipes]